MPDPHDTLSTFAQVSVALVGFSGIVIAFGRRSFGAMTPLELRRLSNLFLFGGGVLLFSLVGMSLLHTTIEHGRVWAIGSALLTVFGVPWVILDARKILRLDVADRAGVDRYIYYPINAVGIAMLLLQLANALVIHDSWPFFVALAFAIAFALQQFILLVRSGIGDA
jgi:hypothetical protein